MNIAMLTTWNSACGIAEYSTHLVGQFQSMGHNQILFVNNAAMADYTLKNIRIQEKCFGVEWWGEKPEFKTKDIKYYWNQYEKSYGTIDVLIIQYQSTLYQEKGFNELLQWVSCPIVAVRHDSSVHPKHKLDLIDSFICHNRDIKECHYIPFPTIEIVPNVFSFGMGRNDYDFIKQACQELGINFLGWDSRVKGWIDERTLFGYMRNADAIVLWYNDVSLKGQSAALRTAISSHRPVIVNDIGWFANAPSFVYKVPNHDLSKEFTKKEALKQMLWEVLNMGYIRTNSYERCAEKYMEVINSVRS